MMRNKCSFECRFQVTPQPTLSLREDETGKNPGLLHNWQEFVSKFHDKQCGCVMRMRSHGSGLRIMKRTTGRQFG